MEAVVRKHWCTVLLLCWVTNGNAGGHVVPQQSPLLLKTNGNNLELYESKVDGGSWLQAMLLFARGDQTGFSSNGTFKSEAVITSETRAAVRCPNEFVTLGEHCFYFSLNTAKWHDALQLCQSVGSDLAHPTSAVENALLVNYIRNYHKGSNAWWTGGTDEESEGEWVWAHSKAPIVFTDSISNQPDNSASIEHCMSWLEKYDWKWNDSRCNNTNRYICQI